jgi:hypothetical protein
VSPFESEQPEEASADAAPEGASAEGRPEEEAGDTGATEEQDALRDEDQITDPDPEQQDPESGSAA